MSEGVRGDLTNDLSSRARILETCSNIVHRLKLRAGEYVDAAALLDPLPEWFNQAGMDRHGLCFAVLGVGGLDRQQSVFKINFLFLQRQGLSADPKPHIEPKKYRCGSPRAASNLVSSCR
jgi:hypothetical protein